MRLRSRVASCFCKRGFRRGKYDAQHFKLYVPEEVLGYADEAAADAGYVGRVFQAERAAVLVLAAEQRRDGREVSGDAKLSSLVNVSDGPV